MGICPQVRPREQICRGRPAELDGPFPTTFPDGPWLPVEIAESPRLGLARACDIRAAARIWQSTRRLHRGGSEFWRSEQSYHGIVAASLSTVNRPDLVHLVR